MPTVWFTRHALDKMERRGVTRNEVIDIIRDPHVIEPDSYGNKRYVRNGLAIPVAERDNGLVVITVLLRETTQWSDTDVRSRNHQTQVRQSWERKS